MPRSIMTSTKFCSTLNKNNRIILSNQTQSVLTKVNQRRLHPSPLYRALHSWLMIFSLCFGNCPSRHLLFVTHFPLPQDDSCSHNCNQRHVLLYGVGKGKDEARHVVKKMFKEIMKLFSKKCSMIAADGGKVKKHPSKGEFNFETTMTRFQNLSYFDQHVVTTSCMSSVIEMLNSFASGNSNYLPVML